MKSDGVHITLCCEHCGERVALSEGNYNCPHCDRRCTSNVDVAGALMKVAESIQAMTPAELNKMLDREPKETCHKCNGRGFRTTKIPDGKKNIGTVESVCRTCDGKGRI